MRDPCARWETWAAGQAPRDGEERERHLAACPSCREQWTAHVALGALAEVELPPLSRDLGPALGRAVAALETDGVLTPGRRLLMRAYWLAATFAAGLVLAQLGPAPGGWLAFWVFLGAVALAALPALLLLRRRLSWDLMDLVVWTLD